MFIVLDGIDGSGKGTQVRLVKESLEKLGKTVKIYDYPKYGEKSAYMVEKYLNGEYGSVVSPKLASIFYAMDRFDDSFNFRGDIKKYDYVISNRYVSANMIHQSGKIKDPQEKLDFLKWLDELEYGICNIPRPHKVLFLDVSPETSKMLRLERGDKSDLHESDEQHIRDAYNTANQLVKIYPYRTKIKCERGGDMIPKGQITKLILEQIL